MNIIYISSVCSQSKFDNGINDKTITTGYQNQKFHHLLLDGLVNCVEGRIDVVSKPPINHKPRTILPDMECIDDITYHYIGYRNLPIIKHFIVYRNTYNMIKRLHKYEPTVIVCNVMDDILCYAAQAYARRHNAPIVGIATDVPGITSNANSGHGIKSFLSRIVTGLTLRSARSYDGYMFLAEAMNSYLNLHNKPYIIIEGFADNQAKVFDAGVIEKSNPKVIMYAGGTHRQYGLPMLVDAFTSIQTNDWNLHIYGQGNYDTELRKVCEKDHRIKFWGLKPNAEIIRAQREATLLVNPRPTHEEFVKYSFPSKTMECMASGTPLLTTKIPSMPADYYDHVYLIEDESATGFVSTLMRVMSYGEKELEEKGRGASQFVLRNKNNIMRARDFYQFIDTKIVKK